MKKFTQIVAALTVLILAVALAGCSAPENDVLEIDASLLREGVYTYNVRYSSSDAVIDRVTTYTVKRADYEGKPACIISSSVEYGTEYSHNTSVLLAQAENGFTALSPLYFSLDYGDSENHINDVKANATHNLSAGMIEITVSQYPQNGGTEMETRSVSVAASGQYYDSEAMHFIIGTLPLKKEYSRNFSMSSVNRDALASMNLQTDELTVKINDKDVRCYCVLLRPNTAFTNYGTYMYYDIDNGNMPVMIQDNTYRATLVSYQELSEEPDGDAAE